MSKGGIIGLKVETHPKFTLEELASQLADYLQGSVDAQNDVLAYQEQIRTERRKIQNDKILVDQIKTFRSNPPKKISRMEPMMQYDLKAIEDEIALAEQRITDWNDLIKTADEKLKRCQAESLRIQKELKERNSKK